MPIHLPKTGADAKAIREKYKMSQQDWCKEFGGLRENVSKIERSEKLSRMSQWFYWYVRTFGPPKKS